MAYYITEKDDKVELDINDWVIYLDDKKIIELNIDGMKQLKCLSCVNNNLTQLNVQEQYSLEFIYCANNPLTELNIKGLNLLMLVQCDENLFDTEYMNNSHIEFEIVL